MSQKITPFLWFDNQAEEAVRFYTSIFQDSKIGEISYYGEMGPLPPGAVMTISFELNGQEFTALNGGPEFQFTPAVSFFFKCRDQSEVEYYWDRLKEGGSEVQCGWLTDQYGLSWQIVPEVLSRLLADSQAERASRVMNAMLKMVKIDIQGLMDAYHSQ